MLEKLESILEHFASLDHRLAEVGQDYQLAAELSKERSDLEPLVELAKEYKENFTKADETRELIEISEGEMLELDKMELDEILARREELEAELKSMFNPPQRIPPAISTTSSSKFGPGPVVMRRDCLLPTSCECT